MEALLERLSSAQIVAVISILCGSVVGIVMILAIVKYQFQLLADDTELKRERQQAELALRQKVIERAAATGANLDFLLAPETSGEPDGANAELAKRFGMLSASAEEIERTLARALAADTAHKKMIVEVMDELFDSDASHDAILAAVRPLCAATPRETPASVPVPVPGA